MRHIHSFPGLILVLLSLGGCALAPPPPADDEGTVVQIQPIEVPRARMAPEPIPAVFMLPTGKGPFPAVIVLHGVARRRAPKSNDLGAAAERMGVCGFDPGQHDPARADVGFARRTCSISSRRADRVADVGAAVVWLRTRPEIDLEPDRGARRFARRRHRGDGGAAHLRLFRVTGRDRLLRPLRRAGRARQDPAAGAGRRTGTTGATLAEALRTLRQGALRPGQIFEVHTYPETYHAFDNPDLTHAVNNGHILAFNVVAAEDSFDRVRAFLDRWVRH